MNHSFYQAARCPERINCVACRCGDMTELSRRYGLRDDFACPFGVTQQSLRDGALFAAAPPEPPLPQATRQNWRGLGDVIASATKAVGIKPCGGCRKRQEKLNQLVPFGHAAGRSNQDPPGLSGSRA